MEQAAISIGAPVRRRARATTIPHLPIALGLIAAVLIVECADISGDYPSLFDQAFYELVPGLREYTMIASSILVGAMVAVAVGRLLLQRPVVIPVNLRGFIVFFSASCLFGAVVGLIAGNEARYVLGDSRNAVVYVALIAVGPTAPERTIRFVRRLLFAACGIILVKLALSAGAGVLVGRAFSWRYLFKASSFFLPMLLLTLALFMRARDHRARLSALCLFVLAVLGLFTAHMRGLYLGLVGGLFVIAFWTGGVRRAVRMLGALTVLLAMAVVMGVLLQGDVWQTFGDWTSDTFQAGYTYREQQAAFLTAAFWRHWLVGSGLGWFDPSYEGFAHVDMATIPRPYLKELEFLNLLAKLGIVGSGLLVTAFAFVFKEAIAVHRLARNNEHRAMVEGLTAGLVAFLVASITQTGYSGLMFHVYVVLLLLTLRSVRQASHHATQRSPPRLGPAPGGAACLPTN